MSDSNLRGADDATAAMATGQPASNVVAFRAFPARRSGHAAALRCRLDAAGDGLAAHVCDAFDSFERTCAAGAAAHAATAVAVLATLAAECALRAAETDMRRPLAITADGWVLGAPADGLLFLNGESYAGRAGFAPSVFDLVAEGLRDADAAAPLPDLDRVVAASESHMGTKPYPVLTIPRAWQPQALLRAAAARHRERIATIAAAHGFCTPGETALALGAAIATIIRRDVASHVLAQLAAEVMIGAARLAPLPYAVN